MRGGSHCAATCHASAGRRLQSRTRARCWYSAAVIPAAERWRAPSAQAVGTPDSPATSRDNQWRAARSSYDAYVAWPSGNQHPGARRRRVLLMARRPDGPSTRAAPACLRSGAHVCPAMYEPDALADMSGCIHAARIPSCSTAWIRRAHPPAVRSGPCAPRLKLSSHRSTRPALATAHPWRPGAC